MNKKLQNRIKTAIHELKIDKKIMYSVKELEMISRAAKCEMLDTMLYLRYYS